MSLTVEDEFLNLSPEEIKQMGKILADIVAEQGLKVEYAIFTCVSGYEIVREEEIAEVIDLDVLSSATHGITDVLGEIAGWFSSILNSVASWIVASIQAAIAGVVSAIVSAISNIISGIVSTISAALSAIASTISGIISGLASTLMSALTGAVSAITGMLSSAVSTIVSAVSGIISAVTSAISGIVSAIQAIASGLVSAVTSAISGIVSAVTSAISGVLSALSGLASTLMSAITGAIAAISGAITGLASAIMSAITGAVSALASAISGLASAIMSAITGAVSAIAGALTAMGTMIVNALTTAVSTISSAVSGLASAIMNALTTAVSAITGALSTIASTIMSAISGAIRMISEAVSGFVRAVMEYLGNVAKMIVEGVWGFFKMISEFIGNVAKGIMDGVTNIYKGIGELWKFLVDSFKTMAIQVGEGFKTIGLTLTGFVNSILQVGTWIREQIAGIGKIIWDAFPEWLRKTFADVGEFFRRLLDALAEFIRNPVEWFKRNVAPAFMVDIKDHMPHYSPSPQAIHIPYPMGYIAAISIIKGLPIYPEIEILTDPFKWLTEKIVNALSGWVDYLWNAAKGVFDELLKTLTNTVTNVLKTIWDSLTGIVDVIGGMVMEGLKEMFGKFVKTGSPKLIFASKEFEEFIHGVYDPLNALTAEVADGLFKPLFIDVLKMYAPPIKIDDVSKQTITLWLTSIGVMTLPFWGQIPVRLFSWVLKAIARWLGGIDWKVRIDLRPLGIGVNTQFDFAKAFGATTYDMAESLMKWLDEIGRGLVYGFAIWFSRPITKITNMLYRNIIPVEIPREEIIIELLRRSMPLEEFPEKRRMAGYFLALQGYSDYVIDSWLKSAEDLNIKVKDRFDVERTIPLSLMYELPSASDVARMAIRDIFGMGKTAIDAFLKVYSARGMHEDIGILYYLLHYRYPPPERLWTFVTRGFSGMLWATIPKEMMDSIQAEASRLKAPIPTPSSYWNFKAKELFTALQTYMTWHDYFRASWIRKEMFGWSENFTSDNQIMIDTLADIPTKIDQRWMIKWGIYEHLSIKGVKLDSPVKDFALKVLENAPISEVKMDLTNFSRTLQATGLHPDWVPVTALAETMNALSEERTLLRTGFINLFKEGFYDVKSLETLLAGFVKASFQVAYFDMDKMMWTTGWINIPVMYLPPERKLLELRALMDRALDILREIQRDISTAYQEYIIWDYNEYKAKLTEVINNINVFYAEDYKNITGVELPEALKLKFVEEYYKPYVEALRIWRDVFTIRRVRAWTMRWLGWVMYRVAYGVVRREDVEKLITHVSGKAKLTDYEKEFIHDVLDIMYGMAASEYLPTPSTLATLSEYITLDPKLIGRVLEERRVPEEWRNIWLTYISVRPIKADAKSLLSTYVKALRQGVVSKDDVDKFVKELPQYGFTQREIELIMRSIDLEEQIVEARESRREYIPTPLTLASICEYIPEARKFFEDVVKARRIPERWRELWARYVDIRPLVDDIKRYVSRAEALYVRFMTKKDDFEKILQEASKYLGYTSKEMEFLMKVTEFERYRNAWTELIGSVERLVSLSEYSPRASKYALGKLKEMIDALPLTAEEKNELKAMWEEYIKNRPVKSEAKTYVTQLINAYVDGLMDEATFVKELEAMKEWGFSDYEIMFYKAQAVLRKARKLRVPIGG